MTEEGSSDLNNSQKNMAMIKEVPAGRTVLILKIVRL